MMNLGPDFEIDHIGVAVNSLEKAFAPYQAMGWQKLEVEEVPTEKVRVGFLSFHNQANIELLEPTAPESPIAKFLAKRGEGVHHICFRVKNVQEAIDQLKGRGMQMIDEKPRPGAHGCQVAFIHPKSAGGVLIELSQRRLQQPHK